MEKSVSVVLVNGERIDLRISASEVEGMSAADARALIGQLCAEADIEGTTRTGKVLIVDQIILLAQDQRNDVWKQPTPALRRFLAASLLALGRDTLTINLQEMRL